MCIQFRSLLLELSRLHQPLSKTQQLHALITKTHLSHDPFYATRIIRFYAINHDLFSARNLFDETPHRSVYLWNSIIRAYATDHKFTDAFSLFKQMLCSETKPDNFTFACILRGCAENSDVLGLRLVHGGVVVSSLGLDHIVSSALVAGYSKLGFVDEARLVFNCIGDPDLVLWNSMVSGYGFCGYWDKGLELFSLMRSEGKKPDGYTLVGLISSLVDPSLLEIGQGVHGFCLKLGFDSIAHIGSVLVSMYSRCKCLDSALQVFGSLSEPDLVTWSALITGFGQSGNSEKSLMFFKKMSAEGKKADPILLASLLAATAQLAIVGPGSELHCYVLRHGFESEIMVSSALIDMYFKCGFLHLGIKVFDSILERNTVSYNSVISGLGLHGLASEAFEIFKEMLEKGFEPSESTFSALLCACCHSGLAKEGREYFRRMKDEFGISPRIEHYVYLIKLLGMAGELEETYSFIQSLPEPVDSSVWGALLSCCDALGNSELAEVIAHKFIEDKPEESRYRVMLSNVYAGDGRWDEAKKLRDGMNAEMRKMAGISWI
ncbi:putative pentatricopeptide repeat-containing protein At1g64310 [Rhododendron vialii]|uniref:putative pentatricopeptide repeat-containing protein At1g64310 n=1 Tax=Rhododendron vialii TaxID=182163 RepID=UPI00265F8D0D|nr:putative pentatricopeptide repeat-containing protein At1g64310 [Rhododendron vialii]XP_058193672.1 putative pentatricopeptide repeat-containing protein At1g64310 [Rhododendron vialii]XP_058193673.1 putative pentatricopeptide repeat-containing protein At1g64310 [Rhododendron vialii]